MDEEQEKPEAEAEVGEDEAEYAFDGYRVELNERIALTPPAAGQRAEESGHG